MAKKTLTIWVCDNCTVQDEKESQPYGWGWLQRGGSYDEYKDWLTGIAVQLLCPGCSDAVLTALSERAK